jgi:hypothetical protein
MADVPLPIVRYMIVCDDILTDPERPGKPMLVGLICLLAPDTEPPYPFWLSQMCVLLILAEGRGTGTCELRLIFEETGEVVWQTKRLPIAFGPDPVALRGVIFRDHQVPFPARGVYIVQFWYNDQMLAQQTIVAR